MTKYGFHGNNLDVNRINTKRITVESKVPVEYVIPYTIAYGTGNILGSTNWHTATTTKTNTTIKMQPPYPAVLSVTAVQAGTAAHADKITFVGVNAWGSVVYDSVYVQATAAGIAYTSNAYAKITSIYPTSAAGDKKIIKSPSVCIGIKSGVIGLPYPIASSADIISYQKGGTYATTTPITLTSTTYRTVTIATTAAKVVKIIYKSKVQKDWGRQYTV